MTRDLEKNPLLDIQHPIAFDRIRAEHVEPAISQLLQAAREKLDALGQKGVPPDYAHTMAALEDSTLPLEYAMTVVAHLEQVATTPELREAYNAVQSKVSELMSGIPMSSEIFANLNAFASSPTAASLDPTRSRFLRKTLDWFKREGAGLSPQDKTLLSKINVELSEVTTKYSENVLDSTNAYEFVTDDVEQLVGLPARVIEAARASAETKGKSGYRFTLQAPSFIPVLTYAHDRALRERIYRASNARAGLAPYDNRPLVARILELRRQKARLLGFSDFVDLVLSDRMAQNGQRAQAFVADLEARTREAFARENAELQAFAGIPLQPWDVMYYSEKQRIARYAFDEEELRPYFSLPNVLAGMFGLVDRIYGIAVKEVTDIPVWHDSVRAFVITDSDDTVLGYFYADFYPRESKRDGAWMNGFITGEMRDGKHAPHVGLICANVTPPTADSPALLDHREVETVFHEFGHLLHHLLSRVEVRSLSGTNVAWDFVELPSQIMENFCWKRESVDLFARHYRTGGAIPDALWDKMLRARTYRGANVMMRQVGFATLDLDLHRSYDPERDGPLLDYARNLIGRFAATELPEQYAMVLSFGHLFSHPVGYAGGYYSYKWAEVLDADAFSRFEQAGVFSREVGLAFRQKVLEKGDSRDPLALFEAFMGRAPDLQALLKRSGIETASVTPAD